MTNAKSTTTAAAAKPADAKPANLRQSKREQTAAAARRTTAAKPVAARKTKIDAALGETFAASEITDEMRDDMARAMENAPVVVKRAATVKPAAVKPAAVKRSTPVDVTTLTGTSELFWPCANCDAAPGARCTQKSGRVKTYFHADRARSVELFAKYGISDAKKLAAAAAKDSASK